MNNQEINHISPEDLGSMGESYFKLICKNVGLVANSSESDDKGGWDFEIEYRMSKKINYSSQSYPVIRVQVKSTASAKNETKLTYSNLLKLIQYNGASFIVMMKYSKSMNPNPDNVFILHIDKSFSKSILKEMRNKQVALKKFVLNKNTKIINFSSSYEIKPINGKSLIRAFDKYIGSDYLKYVENKNKYLSQFEKYGQIKQFDVTFKSKKDITAMANCFLGYKERFNIDIDEFSAPFGIKDNKSISKFEDFNTTISPTNDVKTKIFFKSSEHGIQYAFIGTSYMVPQQLQSFSSKWVRTKCKLFDFLFDFNSRSIRIESKNFTDEIKVDFKELHNFFCFLNDSLNSNNTYIKLVDVKTNKKAEVCLDRPLFEVKDDFQIIYKAINSTYKKLCELNLENSVISTNYIWTNIGRFMLFNIMNEQYIPELEIPFENKKKEEPDANMVIFNSTIELDQTNLVTFVAFFGKVERVNENFLLGRFNRSEFIDNYLLGKEENIDELIKSKSEHYKNIFIDKGFRVLE